MKKKLWIKIGVLLSVIIGILILDLMTKYVFDATLSDGRTVTVIPYLFNFRLTHNLGAAWGMLAGKQLFLIALSVIFLAIFIYYYVKEENKSWLLTITFAFLIGGCLGNLYDRIFIGYVRDFIQFDFWKSFPIFNFADTFLTIGIVMFVIYLILYFVKNHKKGEKKPEKTEKEDKND